jgi:hypothetical protein
MKPEAKWKETQQREKVGVEEGCREKIHVSGGT